MNIAIGKSGRSCFFNEKHWDMSAGDDSPKILYYYLANKYPQHKFYLIGASDYQDCKKRGIDIPENIIDVFGMARKDVKANPNKYPEVWQYQIEQLNNMGVKFDLGIIMQGPDMSCSIKGVGVKNLRDNTQDIKPLCMATNYVAPLQAVINEQKFPWVNINEDARYIPWVNRDIIEGHDELLTFSQINCAKTVKRIKGYYDQAIIYREHIEKFKYSGIEHLFLVNEKKIDFTDPDNIVVGDNVYKKTNKFIMAQSGGGDRLEMIEKWVLNDNPSQIIYGKWDEEAQAKHPGVFVNKMMKDMDGDFWSSMFTYVPAFNKRFPNFVTKKPWTLLHHGIIPFFDKNGYDVDKLLPFPELCRVETPQQMWERIDYLYNNRDEYKKVLKVMYSYLKDEYFNGSYIDNLFGKIIDNCNKQ